MDYQITILTHDPRWRGLVPTVRRGVEEVMSCQRMLASSKEKALDATSRRFLTVSKEKGKTGVWHDSFSITLVLSNDAEVKELNHQFRAKNKPTNVLSFPDGELVDGTRQLGDVILAYETIAAEAEAQGKALKHHIAHLAIHGTLHLLGFDHEAEAEAARMEAIEIKLLARMGIANPYQTA